MTPSTFSTFCFGFRAVRGYSAFPCCLNKFPGAHHELARSAAFIPGCNLFPKVWHRRGGSRQRQHQNSSSKGSWLQESRLSVAQGPTMAVTKTEFMVLQKAA